MSDPRSESRTDSGGGGAAAGGLRVLHVLESFPPIISGYSSRGAAIVAAQEARPGLSPHVLVTSRQGVYGQGPATPPAGMEDRLVEVPPSPRERRVRRWRAFDLDGSHLQRQIEAACERWDIEVVHCHWSSGIGDAAAEAARRRKLPLVAEVRFDLAGAMMTETLRLDTRWIESRLRRRFERYVPDADAVVAASWSLAGLIEAQFPTLKGKVQTLPNGSDGLARADPAAAAAARGDHGLDDKIVVGTTSNMLRYEGLDRLIHALAQAQREVPQVHGLLVGSGAQHETLKQLARGLDAPVTFTGRVPHARVPALLAAMDLFVVPRRSASITRFAAPIKLIEAMAAGRAVLASGVGDIPHLLGEGRGVVVEAGDDAALLEQIITLTRDAGRRDALGTAAAAWVADQPTWADLAKQYEDIYRRCRSAAQTAGGAGR